MEGDVAEHEERECLDSLLGGLLHDEHPLGEDDLHGYLLGDRVVLSDGLRVGRSLEVLRIDEPDLQAVLIGL